MFPWTRPHLQELRMITKEQIYDEIVRVLKRDLMIDADLKTDTTLESLGLDSIQMMQLFVYIEQSFNFEFAPDSSIDSVRSLSLWSFTDFVHQSAIRQLTA
jgi:acyl carrier protein